MTDVKAGRADEISVHELGATDLGDTMLKTVSLTMTGQTFDQDATRVACQVAKSMAGRLRVHFVRPDPKAAIAFMGEGLTAETIQTLADTSEREGLDAAAKAEAHVRSVGEAAGLTFGSDLSFTISVGTVSDQAGRRARVSDIAICPQPASRKPDCHDILDNLMFKSGRLMMMVPKESKTVGRHVVIAWNGRAEGARAVGASVPLLAQAEQVTALQVGEIDGERPNIDDLEDYLNAFDVPVTVTRLENKGGPIAPQIHAHALHIGADSLVIGAYSHARWQEMILGGATRWLVEHSRLPVIMSH